MFDIGFSEIVLIAVIAIVVLGPERLPELGRHIGKAMRMWRGVKDDFSGRVREAIVIDPPRMIEPTTAKPVQRESLPPPGEAS